MQQQKPALMYLSGRDRYLVLDALDKRISTLNYRASTRTAKRQDLDDLEAELKALRQRLASEQPNLPAKAA